MGRAANTAFFTPSPAFFLALAEKLAHG